jgi:hypothetical protein
VLIWAVALSFIIPVGAIALVGKRTVAVIFLSYFGSVSSQIGEPSHDPSHRYVTDDSG